MRKIILALIFVMALASFAFADTIVLRDGRTIRGTVLGFANGRFVVRVENPNVGRSREGDIQYFRPDEIERIEIEGRSLDDGRFDTRNVQVTLSSDWIDSGVWLRRGEQVEVSATGVITTGRSRITPDGLRSTDPTAPLPNAPEGKLIGAIGNDPRSPIIELGSQRAFTAERNGRLFLTANRGTYNDARGGFTVQIRSERNLSPRDNSEDRGGIRSRNRSNDDFGRNRQRELTISVPGNSRSLDTGIDVRAGDPINITATGLITAGARVGQVGPDGQTRSGFGGINARPVPSAGVGALVGYIRTVNGQLSAAYLIGSQLSSTVPTDGRLILGINDDNFGDNSGEFRVTIRY